MNDTQNGNMDVTTDTVNENVTEQPEVVVEETQQQDVLVEAPEVVVEEKSEVVKEVISFEQAVVLGRQKWKCTPSKVVDGDEWISISKNYDLNIYVDLEDPSSEVSVHLHEVNPSGLTDTDRWYILCADAKDDRWSDAVEEVSDKDEEQDPETKLIAAAYERLTLSHVVREQVKLVAGFDVVASILVALDLCKANAPEVTEDMLVEMVEQMATTTREIPIEKSDEVTEPVIEEEPEVTTEHLKVVEETLLETPEVQKETTVTTDPETGEVVEVSLDDISVTPESVTDDSSTEVVEEQPEATEEVSETTQVLVETDDGKLEEVETSVTESTKEIVDGKAEVTVEVQEEKIAPVVTSDNEVVSVVVAPEEEPTIRTDEKKGTKLFNVNDDLVHVMDMTVKTMRQRSHVTHAEAVTRNNKHYMLKVKSNIIKDLFVHGISMGHGGGKTGLIEALEMILTHWEENLGVIPDNTFAVAHMRLVLDQRIGLEVDSPKLLSDSAIRKCVLSHYKSNNYSWTFRSILPAIDLVDTLNARVGSHAGDTKTRIIAESGEWTPYLEDMEDYFGLEGNPESDVDVPDDEYNKLVGITLRVLGVRNPRLVGHVVKMNALANATRKQKLAEVISTEKRISIGGQDKKQKGKKQKKQTTEPTSKPVEAGDLNAEDIAASMMSF